MSGLFEHVNGTVIGTFYHAYRFYSHDRRCLTRTLYFVDDDEAEAWVKESYPDEYRTGVEMRCYTDTEAK